MNKRTFLVGLASVLTHASATSQPSSSSLAVQIEDVSAAGKITVSLRNTGQEPLRLWNSGRWNVGTWRVLHISATGGALTTYYEDPDQIIDVRPRYMELARDMPSLRKLDLSGFFWLPRRETRIGENIWATGDTLIVIYDIPMTAEGDKLGVWWGVAAAKAIVQ